MRRTSITVVVAWLTATTVFAQDAALNIRLVAEYPVSTGPTAAFLEPSERPYAETGLRLACDMSGCLYIVDYEKMCIDVVDDIGYQVLRNFSIKQFIYSGTFMGDDDGIYYVSSLWGQFAYFTSAGEELFSGALPDIMPFTSRVQILSSYYYAGILFFMDNDRKVHSIIHPSMDKELNRKNYRDPEQTKKLFVADSGLDLQGLTMNAAGHFFLEGNDIGPSFCLS